MVAEWRITSYTRKAHLYIDGNDTAVCKGGKLRDGFPYIVLPNNNDSKCRECARFEKKMKMYPGGEISYGQTKTKMHVPETV